MNRPIDSLLITLKWKQHGLCNQLLAVEKQLRSVEHDIQDNQQKTNESCALTPVIIPEHDIARSHFFIVQQQNQQELRLNQTALQSDQQDLITQQKNLNRTLKMLEKHHHASVQIQQKNVLRNEQNSLDEWALQRRDLNESE